MTFLHVERVEHLLSFSLHSSVSTKSCKKNIRENHLVMDGTIMKIVYIISHAKTI